MPHRHVLAAAVPLLLIAGVGLSGCGADEGPKPLATGSAEPTPTESASPTPTVPAGVPTEAPTPPSGAAESVASAKAYNEFVVSLVDYVSESRDSTPLDEQVAAGARCEGCAFVGDYAAKLAENNQFSAGADARITKSVAQPVTGQKGVFTALTLFDYPNKKLLESDGTVVTYTPGKEKFVCLTTLTWEDDGWRVRDLSFRKATGDESS